MVELPAASVADSWTVYVWLGIRLLNIRVQRPEVLFSLNVWVLQLGIFCGHINTI